MHTYIAGLIDVIANGAMDNTYKVAWARALAELCVEHSPRQDYHFDEFATLVFKYYWNQSIFFGLQQGPSANRRPEIHAMVLQAIDEYQLAEGLQPRTFIEVAQNIDVPVQRINTVLAQDVRKRFVRLVKARDRHTASSVLKQRTITSEAPAADQRSMPTSCSNLINYRWAQEARGHGWLASFSQEDQRS